MISSPAIDVPAAVRPAVVRPAAEPSPMDDARTLVEQLVAALRLKEASDPDCPAWAADLEIRRLERAIVSHWFAGDLAPVALR
jgi:hypothetical protein